MERTSKVESTDLPKSRRHGDPPEEPITRAAWKKHRDHLMSFSVGCRPDGWWLYERNMQPPGPPHAQTLVLFELGEFQGSELKIVLRWFRDFYDSARELFPDDPTKYWRWKAIPPKLIKQWDAECRAA
jgi:hypothetical protein